MPASTSWFSQRAGPLRLFSSSARMLTSPPTEKRGVILNEAPAWTSSRGSGEVPRRVNLSRFSSQRELPPRRIEKSCVGSASHCGRLAADLVSENWRYHSARAEEVSDRVGASIRIASSDGCTCAIAGAVKAAAANAKESANFARMFVILNMKDSGRRELMED